MKTYWSCVLGDWGATSPPHEIRGSDRTKLCAYSVEGAPAHSRLPGGFLYSQHSTDDNILEKGYLIAPCVCTCAMCWLSETGALECACAREERRLMNSSEASSGRRKRERERERTVVGTQMLVANPASASDSTTTS